MPTIHRPGPYRIFFYSGDRSEPPHVHVARDEFEAKFWLDPVRLQRSGGFDRRELRRIQEIIEHNEEEFLKAWYEHFPN